MADIFNIAGEINSTSQEGTAVHANQVKDDLQNKKQSQINEEVGEELALHTNRLNALTGQNYVTVVATQSTTAADIPTLINASGEGEQTNTLYRVGFWDGSAYVADKYTEYAWNGTAYVILDVKSSIGEVFDISQYNAVGGTLATYADLATALGASGANVPSSVRRGGMSIKFVQSIDNKYVQFRCMAQNFTTDVTQWQGVDDEPTAGSRNLVESGGVLSRVCKFIGKGNTIVRQKIKLVKNHTYALYLINPNYNVTGVIEPKFGLYYDSENVRYNIISKRVSDVLSEEYLFTMPNVDVDYCYLFVRAAEGESVYYNLVDITFANLAASLAVRYNEQTLSNEQKTQARKNIDIFADINIHSCSVIGNNSSIIETYPKVLKGHTYQVCIFNPNWSADNIGSNNKFGIKSGNTNLCRPVPYNETVSSLYEFTVPDNNESVWFYFRADFGVEIFYQIVDVTEAKIANTNVETLRNDVNTNVETLRNEYHSNVMSFNGKGETLITSALKFKIGNTYRLNVINPNWEYSLDTRTKFQLKSSNNTNVFVISGNHSVDDYYIFTAETTDYTLYIRGDVGQTISVAFDDISSETSLENDLKYSISDVYFLIGNGGTISEKKLKLCKNTSYELNILNPDWDITGIGIQLKLGLYYTEDGVNKYIVGGIGPDTDVNYTYVFNTPNKDIDEYTLFIRASVGTKVYYSIQQEIVNTEKLYEFDCQYNIERQFRQLADIVWTPKADVLTNEGLRPAGTPVTSIPYSSVKELMKYVGIDVSIHTFMTAVNNVHSLLYTERVLGTNSISAYGITYYGVNARSYYGSVCSGAVTTALGKKIQYNSWEYQRKALGELFFVLPNQDEQNLLVGDILSEPGHCSIITFVKRDKNGVLQFVVLSEHKAPIRRTTYTYAQIRNRRYANKGVWCRCKDLSDNVNYKPCVFVLYEDEYLYRNGIDIVFRDIDTTRTYYKCKSNNRDSAFDASKWNEIDKWVQKTAGNGYAYNAYAQNGEFLYKSIKGDNISPTSDATSWELVKGVFEWNPYPYVYNDDIVTFAGDRASFKLNDLIYINYEKGSYSKMQIFKNGIIVQTLALPNDDSYQLNVSSYCSGYGIYKARLINDDASVYSRYTYFEVIDNTNSASVSNGEVNVSFSSANGIPFEVQLVEVSGYPISHYRLNDIEINRGNVIFNPVASAFVQPITKHYIDNTTEMFIRVMFEGEYGNVPGDMVSIGTIGSIIGYEVTPDETTDFGIITNSVDIVLNQKLIGKKYDFSFTAGENGLSVNIVPSFGLIKWKNELPSTLANGTTYLVTVINGIGNVVPI